MNKDRLRATLASGLGTGMLPLAPGTWGTLPAVLLHIVIVMACPEGLQLPLLATALVATFAVGAILAPWSIKHWGKTDPGHFVLDEIAGYLCVPVIFNGSELWQVALWGFLGFRFFDIVKVPPAWQIDRKMKNGWGIMLDDIVSGIYTALALYFVRWLTIKIGFCEFLLS